jgi:hypothetical protein
MGIIICLNDMTHHWYAEQVNTIKVPDTTAADGSVHVFHAWSPLEVDQGKA